MNKKIWVYILTFLLLIVVLSWLALLGKPTENLKIIVCDVGQGDAILVTKANFQLLIDGGPGNRVTSCLGRHIPFWDRRLEVVVLTHPDADHSTGLVKVVETYKVDNFLTTELEKDTKVYKTLKDLIKTKEIKTIFAKSGDRFGIGEIKIEVLSPTTNMLAEVDKEKANNYSVVMKLSYHDFDALLTGDIETSVSDQLAYNYYFTAIEYLKVPHHGSKNGLSRKLLDEVSPDIAVISAGRDNQFGHPHPDITEMLKGYKVLGTYNLGDVIVESDGKAWWLN